MNLLGRSLLSNETSVAPSLTPKECEFPDNPYYILFVSIVSFFLPLIMMTFVYMRVYSAATRQAQALRSGYTQDHSNRSLCPKFKLRERSTIRTEQQSLDPPRKHRPSFQLITLRIHRGSYRNPTRRSSSLNRQDKSRKDSSTRRARRRNETFWRRISRDQKAGTFVGLVMGAFVICWLPYFVYFVLSGVFGLRFKDELNHELLFRIFSWLGYTNSALDVLVYIFTSKDLRTTCTKLFCKSEMI